MHQTFYIDLEEEISSVIDRLNKSMATENYFVVPKRAIFLQSIVNLKLLKREADKIGKQVTIITQDEIGASMAERSGLAVQSAIDEQQPEAYEEEDETLEDDEDDDEIIEISEKPAHGKHLRLSGVGTDSFYDTTPRHHDERANAVKTKKVKVSPVASLRKRIAPIHHESPHIDLRSKKNNIAPAIHAKSKPINGVSHKNGIDSEKERVLEKMYSSNRYAEENEKPIKRHSSSREKLIRNFFLGFIGLCFLAFVGVAGYLFWPSAKIIIEPNVTSNKIDLDLHGSVDVTKADKTNIPVSVIDKDESVTLSYDVKGSSSIAAKKASGSVVIYNNYESSPQTLIATTRLESTDGKIFRIVKNVVVPGTTTVAGEVKPGAITAEVIADQPGVDYNIDPTSFTIPGFKDGPKYDKFSAKSSDKMTGGLTDNVSATGGAISQSDIDNAKQKTEAAIKDKIAQSIAADLPEGVMALPQAEKITITKSNASAKIGTLAAKFDYTVSASVHALVFSEDDVKIVINQSLSATKQAGDVKSDIAKIEYGTVNADFDKNTLDLRIHSDVTSTPVINQDQVKNDLLGKSDDQLSAVLRKYTTIKNVKVEFQPTFISRIPQYSQRVTVEILNNTN